MASFYIVGTPIGNLEDITFRAVKILKTVDYILCEDTRSTSILLKKWDIDVPTLSYHAHSGEFKIEKILGLLSEDKNLALVSDAGTPCISDPGSFLIKNIKERMPEVKVLAIPGPSAIISALSVSGLPASNFTFLGFLPHKKGREKIFNFIKDNSITSVFYESPHRILKSLETMANLIPDRKVVLAKELTKIFEEVISGTPSEILNYFKDNPDKVRGEFVVMVSGL